MNDWRDYQALRHSWGKKPEQKRREKEYNHQYWLDHKEEILRKRKQRAGNTGKESDYEERRKRLTSSNPDENYKGKSISDSDSLNRRVSGEVGDIEDLIKANASIGGYSDDVMENIRQHNQNIIDNITALTARAEKYIKDHNLSGDAQNEYMKKIAEQIDGQMNLALDLTNDSTHKYLESLGAKRTSSGGSSSSSSNKSSKSKKIEDDKTEYIFGVGDVKTSLSSEDRKAIDKAKTVGNLADADAKARREMSGKKSSPKKSTEKKKARDEDYYETMAAAAKKRKEDKKKNRKAKHSAIDTFDENYLEHHGVEGQKWGQRNGPPYPLSSDVSTGKRLIKKAGEIYRERKEKKRIQRENEIAEQKRKAAEEEENAKQAIIKSGDARMVSAAQSKLTTSEFEEAVRRCELNKRLAQSEVTVTDFDRKMSKVKKGVNHIKTGVDAWNTFAQIYNTFSEDPIAKIDGTYFKSQNKKEEDKKDKKKDKKDEAQQSAISVYEDAILAHHGIKDMKWGVRNGPPYPLSSDISTGKRLLKKKNNTTNVNKTANTQGSGLIPVVWGIFVVSSVVKNTYSQVIKPTIDVGKAKKFRKKCDEDRENAVVDKKTKLKKKSEEFTSEEDLKRVNPDYLLDLGGARQNCTNCTVAYEMRRRGFEVEARLKASGRNGADMAKSLFKAKNNVIEMWNKKDEDEALRYFNEKEKLAFSGKNKTLAEKTLSALKSEPGSRGQLLLTWNRHGGHSMVYEVDDSGKVKLLDGQDNSVYSEREARKLISGSIAAQYQRLDNCSVDYKKIKEYVR